MPDEAPPSRPVLPAQICGCPVDSILTPDKTYLAIGDGGRGVILKKMDEDCLLRGSLHPSIRDRLSRVRELAHTGVANLHGVGKEGDSAFLIWEYLEGEAFDVYATAQERTPRELAMAARELIFAVDSLHMQGIAHGSLCANNVIVSPTGTVRLTHISPLLYDDNNVDVHAVAVMLEQIMERRGEYETALGRNISEGQHELLSLRQWGARLAAFIESRSFDDPAIEEPQLSDAPRRRNLWAAVFVMMLGLAVAGAAWFAAEDGILSIPRSFHMPQFTSGK